MFIERDESEKIISAYNLQQDGKDLEYLEKDDPELIAFIEGLQGIPE